jgi:hypothetical protein
MLKDNHARRDKLLAHIKALVYDKGPMTTAQLAKDLKINSRDRKLSYAIQTLKAVGVIESNGSLLAPARRELLKHDYELAYNHSCKLLHIGSYSISWNYDSSPMFKAFALFYQFQKTQKQLPKTALDELSDRFLGSLPKVEQTSKDPAFHAFLEIDFKREVFDHLRTGYYSQIWKPMTEDTEGFSEELKKELIFAVELVSHGTPLKGVCRLCPSNYVQIKDSE